MAILPNRATRRWYAKSSRNPALRSIAPYLDARRLVLNAPFRDVHERLHSGVSLGDCDCYLSYVGNGSVELRNSHEHEG